MTIHPTPVTANRRPIGGQSATVAPTADDIPGIHRSTESRHNPRQILGRPKAGQLSGDPRDYLTSAFRHPMLSSVNQVTRMTGDPLRALVRIAAITLLSCGALLATTGASVAEGPEDGSSLIHRLAGADLGTVTQALPNVFCGNRLISYNSPTLNSPTKCVNGPENSGNSTNSGNYHNEGNAINSGNFSNTNGSTGSSNTTNGGNTANGPQSVSPGG